MQYLKEYLNGITSNRKSMKIVKFINPLLILVCLIAFPEKNDAQQRNVVKVKQSRTRVVRGHTRPIRVRRVAHHRYRHLPRWGRTVRTIGPGYLSLRFGGIGYRFHQGVWYRTKEKRFIISRAPIGIRVGVLPIGHRTVTVGTRTYFYYYETYYCKIESSETPYEVVEPPIRATIDALSEGY